MYITLLKLLWPQVQRLLAQRAADYLQQRRERRLNPPQVALESIDSGAGAESAAQADVLECPPAPTGLSRRNAVWYTLSGVVLGSLIGLILAQIFRRED